MTEEEEEVHLEGEGEDQEELAEVEGGWLLVVEVVDMDEVHLEEDDQEEVVVAERRVLLEVGEEEVD